MSGADVFFDVTANNNVLAGNSGIVKDLGQNNSVSGVPRKGYGPGRTLRDALEGNAICCDTSRVIHK